MKGAGQNENLRSMQKTFSLTYNERKNRNLKLVDYEDSEYDIYPECFESLNEWFDSGESEEEE